MNLRCELFLLLLETASVTLLLLVLELLLLLVYYQLFFLFDVLKLIVSKVSNGKITDFQRRQVGNVRTFTDPLLHNLTWRQLFRTFARLHSHASDRLE